MRPLLLAIVVLATLLGCSTRSFVVKPGDVSKLNEPQWAIKAPPTLLPR